MQKTRQQQLAILIIKNSTKSVISGGGPGQAVCMQLVSSILLFQKAQSHINYSQQILYVLLKSLVKYTCLIHEHISYELNFHKSLSIISLSLSHLFLTLDSYIPYT